MSTIRATTLALTGFGVAPTVASAEIRELGPGERLRRGVGAAALGLLLSILTLPIPIVHFVFPLVALVGGLVLGVRRFGQGELFHRVVGACPFCGRDGRWGLTHAPVRLPRDLSCPACRKTLALEAPRTGG